MDAIETLLQRPGARTLGIVYLLYFVTAFTGVFLTNGFVVQGDAARTANNLLAHEGVYRAGFAIELISNIIYIAVTALFYRLFESVNRGVALVAAFVSLVGCAVQIFAGIFQLVPFVILRDAQLARAASADQLQAAALLAVTVYARTFSISFVVFAFFDLLLGYLIVKSTFLPRFLGVVLMVAGVGWLTFLWPPLASALSFVVLPFGALAEIVLMLWLLVKGVNVPRWQEQARTAQTGHA